MRALLCLTFTLAASSAFAEPDWTWIRQGGPDGTATATDVHADSLGNACVVGIFSGQVAFGPAYSARRGDGPPVILDAGADASGFVVSYYGNGRVRWARRIEALDGFVLPQGVARDGDRCVVTGALRGDADFAPDAAVDGLMDLPWDDAVETGFVALYDQGALSWARVMAGFMVDLQPTDVVVGAGGIFVGGTMHGISLFQSLAGPAVSDDMDDSVVVMDPVQGCEVFAARYAWDGTVDWADRLTESAACNRAARIATHGTYLYVSGTFEGSPATFHGGASGARTLYSGDRDVFVARLFIHGDLSYVYTRPRWGDDQAGGVAAAPDGTMYLTGAFGIGAAARFFLTRIGGGYCSSCRIWERIGGFGSYGEDVALNSTGTHATVLGGFGAGGFDGPTGWGDLASLGGADVFLATVFTEAGNRQYLANAGGVADDYAYGVGQANPIQVGIGMQGWLAGRVDPVGVFAHGGDSLPVVAGQGRAFLGLISEALQRPAPPADEEQGASLPGR